MYCPKCGTQNDDNNFRCTQCNEIIQPAQEPVMPAPSKDFADDPAIRLLIPVGVSGWAMAAGYLGLFSVLLVPAPFSLVAGILALRDIKANPKQYGKGRAIFGIIMGGLGILGMIGVLILVIGQNKG